MLLFCSSDVASALRAALTRAALTRARLAARRYVQRLRACDGARREGECSFMYRYILRESCSQFDSLPLTSLMIVTIEACRDRDESCVDRDLSA